MFNVNITCCEAGSPEKSTAASNFSFNLQEDANNCDSTNLTIHRIAHQQNILNLELFLQSSVANLMRQAPKLKSRSVQTASQDSTLTFREYLLRNQTQPEAQNQDFEIAYSYILNNEPDLVDTVFHLENSYQSDVDDTLHIMENYDLYHEFVSKIYQQIMDKRKNGEDLEIEELKQIHVVEVNQQDVDLLDEKDNRKLDNLMKMGFQRDLASAALDMSQGDIVNIIG